MLMTASSLQPKLALFFYWLLMILAWITSLSLVGLASDIESSKGSVVLPVGVLAVWELAEIYRVVIVHLSYVPDRVIRKRAPGFLVPYFLSFYSPPRIRHSQHASAHLRGMLVRCPWRRCVAWRRGNASGWTFCTNPSATHLSPPFHHNHHLHLGFVVPHDEAGGWWWYWCGWWWWPT